MDLLLDWLLDLYYDYPMFCYVVGGILLLLTLWKPMKVLKHALLIVILLAIVYIGFYLIDSMNVGFQAKDRAIHKTEKALE